MHKTLKALDSRGLIREEEGNIRIFATIDFGQSDVSRMIASFMHTHPAVTTELGYSNRATHD
jgi:DNA-binding transcriptional LysR family regulator